MSYYNIKLIRSGDRCEMYYYSLAQRIGFEARNKAGRKGREDVDTDKQKNRREVLYRARNNIIRLVNSNPDLTSFITLTYADNMQDITQSKEDLHRCISKIQRNYSNFKYLYVLEFQERGAIHYHMLCNFPIPVKTAVSKRRKSADQKAFEQMLSARYWNSNGFVDARDLRQEGNTNVGLYVSTYIVKSLEEANMDGSRVYGYSRNLLRPIEETMLVQENMFKVLADMREYYDVNYCSSYHQTIEYQDGLTEIKHGNVNYFDMSIKKESE